MATVFVPEPGIHVHTAATEADPGGRVVHLTHGWVELDDELASNAVLKRLLPESDAEGKRRLAMLEATKKRREAVGAAEVEYYAKAVEIDNADLEAMRGAEDERAKRIEADAAKGITRVEEHPDPAAQTALSLTADAQYAMVSATGMAGKAEQATVPPATPRTPPANGTPRRATVE